MIDGGPSSEVPQDSSQPEDLPDRLRVHSLARVLGTTSRQVLDALTELDGRIRSAHSTVDRVDAVRVRDLLASAPATVAAPVVATEAGAAVEADEPESRLLLETTVERPEYMPLFVAPQPVKRTVGQDDTDAPDDPDESDDSDDSGDDDDFDADDSDDEQADRPANRRRRRGRRGR
ncbi:MAG: ribonuclease, partial [Mycobacterium sp.]|nr:ribonuclease [Mycobacterium sp.]